MRRRLSLIVFAVLLIALAVVGRYALSRRSAQRVANAAAIVISVSVSYIGRSQGWPHAQSIGLAAFVFLIPVLPTVFKVRGSRSLPQSIVVGLIFALIGGFIHVFTFNQ
jgi:uncharacterized membrane protein YoaK (UPF0700 family)